MNKYNLSQYSFQRKNYDVPKIDLREKGYDMNELIKIRKRLAKVANQRLRTIEEIGKTDAYVYSQTMVYLIGEGRMRFIESNKMTTLKEMKRELEELNAFLKAKTSTVGGIRKFERQTAEVFREKYGLQLKNPESFSKFLSSESFKHLTEDNIVSSEFLIEFYDRAVENGVSETDIYASLEEYEKGNINSWNDIYKDVGLDFFDYIK